MLIEARNRRIPRSMVIVYIIYVHLAFFTLAIKFIFARFDIHLCTILPPRSPDNWTINGVGTTS